MKHTLALLPLLVAACGTPDMNKSIEAMNEGVDAYSTGDLTVAEKKFKLAVQISSDNHRAFYNLGQTLEQRRKWAEAAEAYGEAVKLDGGDAMYHFRLGRALLEAGKNEKAQEHLETAIKKNDKLYKAHFYLGKVYQNQDKIKEAADAWTKSAEANPLWARPFNALGSLYIVWDKLPEAVRVLENGALNVRGEPGEIADIYYHLGFAYEKQNNLDKAIENYTKSLDTKKNSDALRQRGVSYAAKGDIKKAKADLEAFIASGGNNEAFNLQAANELLMKLQMEERR